MRWRSVVAWSLRRFWVFLLILAAGCADKGPTDPEVSEQPGDTLPHPTPDPAAVAWLEAHLEPFDTLLVTADRTDLAFLDDLLGEARIVSLGEATHGTGDFFRLKHRILDYLAREQGVRLFAMEANSPEMNRIDDWVHGGPGDPAELLSAQSSWTWNTQEVLDLILWARAFNRGRPPEDQVSVLGFDMELPGMAIYDVVTYLEAVDPVAAEASAADYECFRLFVNHYPGSENTLYHWATLEESFVAPCRASIARVRQRFADNRDVWIARSSPEAFARAEHEARLVQQSEAKEWGLASRDAFMAENVGWILDQYPPESRIVLWAHNMHVTYAWDHLMGGLLRERYGEEYMAVALAMGEGWFNAQEIVGDEYGDLIVQKAPAAPEDSYEFVLMGAAAEQYFLDLRNVDPGQAGAGFLGEYRRFRFYGFAYTGEPLFAYSQIQLLDCFDALAFFQNTSPSELLAWRLPDSFSYPGSP
jgi:erythromycin esterase